MARVASAADSAAAPAALLRVTVASTHRRVDLMLPGCWPVADLLPELARSVGVLDVRTVHAGYRLVTAAGRELDDQRGLVAQDVTDGAILTVVPGDQLLEARHDDTAEAMAQAVHTTVPGWTLPDSHRAAGLLAGLLLTLGAVLLGLVPTLATTAGAVATACGLTGAGVALSRRAGPGAVPLILASTGAAYAGAAGLLVADQRGLPGHPVTHAAVGAATAGCVSVLGIAHHRYLALPLVLGGAALTGAGVLTTAAGLALTPVLAVLVTLLVAAGVAAPRLASTAMRGPARPRPGDSEKVGPSGVEVAELVGDARLAEDLMAALTATTGLLLLGVAPFLATLRPPAGSALILLCCAVEMLRSRRLRSRVLVAVRLGLGVAGVVATVAALAVRQPETRAATAVGLTLAGLLALLAAGASTWPAERWPRTVDAIEAALLVALVPTALTALGVGPVVAGVVRA